MSYSYSSFDCTSANLEKVALNRFRALVSFIPKECRIFREPWDCSTILCLDFGDCPDSLLTVKNYNTVLVSIAQELGLANAIIFRVGNKFIGWSGLPPAS